RQRRASIEAHCAAPIRLRPVGGPELQRSRAPGVHRTTTDRAQVPAGSEIWLLRMLRASGQYPQRPDDRKRCRAERAQLPFRLPRWLPCDTLRPIKTENRHRAGSRAGRALLRREMCRAAPHPKEHWPATNAPLCCEVLAPQLFAEEERRARTDRVLRN